MKIILAKTAGFCFGVKRAIGAVEDMLDKGEKRIYTLGPIIHNEEMVNNLAARGVQVVDSPDRAEDGTLLVIRTHGVPRSVLDYIKEKGISYQDETCPLVSKIHKIVEKASSDGNTVFIIGTPEHPEVVGIRGYAGKDSFIFENAEQLECFTDKNPQFANKSVLMAAQTTLNLSEWKKCCDYFKKNYTNGMISDTICNATSERQTEAADIASQADMVFVVGSRGSSNTKKLYEVCGGLCTETYLIENASELPLGHIKNAAIKKSDLVIGVCAGASTPAYIIKEAIYKMEEIKNELESEKSFAEALEESLITLNTGDRVRGTVIGITPTEVQVNLGTKQAAYIPVSELTSDPNAKVEDIVKVGDEVEVFVTRVNDADGVITLSKRKADAIKGLEELGKAVEEDTIFEGKVAETLERGVVIYHNGVRVFIPASHCPVARDASLADMAGKTFRFKIIQFDKRKNKIIGSIRNVLREERKAAEEAVWADIAVDKRYKGKVKSLTSYGAFVDIGGVDGMVHISELAWGKIKHPANVVKVGDEIEVYVKELDPEKKRISLGYKDLIENPWEKLKNTYKVGDTVKATVVRLVPFGAFAEVIPGVDGLIHISQIANKRIEHPSSELSVGQEVDAKILDIDLENMKVSLSIRALLEPEVVTEGEKE